MPAGIVRRRKAPQGLVGQPRWSAWSRELDERAQAKAALKAAEARRG
jgi:hypothetical protein